MKRITTAIFLLAFIAGSCQKPIDTIRVQRLLVDTGAYGTKIPVLRTILEVREKHNTIEGSIDPGFYVGMKWSDYYRHITYLTLGKHNIPVTWLIYETEQLASAEPEKPPPAPDPGMILGALTDTGITSFVFRTGGDSVLRVDTAQHLTSYLYTGLSVDTINVYSRSDTAEVIRFVTNTTPSTFWRHVDHRPVAMVLLQVWSRNTWTIPTYYILPSRKPLPKYLRVWENR